MPDRYQLLRWALDNPQPPTTVDTGVFKKHPDCDHIGTGREKRMHDTPESGEKR